MPNIKIAALAVGLSLYTMMTPTHASLGGALDGMLINVTDPVAYQSQTRRGFVGGKGERFLRGRDSHIPRVDVVLRAEAGKQLPIVRVVGRERCGDLICIQRAD